MKVESVALVTGLDNTGSDPPNSPQRQMLLNEMLSHDVRKAEKILASPTTSMVILRGYLPPGVQKGDTYDVEVRIPSRSETTSLRGGWLMPSRMRQMEVMGGSVVTGSVDGLAQGDVLVDSIFEGTSDKVLTKRVAACSAAASPPSPAQARPGDQPRGCLGPHQHADRQGDQPAVLHDRRRRQEGSRRAGARQLPRAGHRSALQAQPGPLPARDPQHSARGNASRADRPVATARAQAPGAGVLRTRRDPARSDRQRSDSRAQARA